MYNLSEEFNRILKEYDEDGDLISFNINPEFLAAETNGDYSGLSNLEEKKLEDFIDWLIERYGNADFIVKSKKTDFCRDDVMNTFGDCVTVYIKPEKGYPIKEFPEGEFPPDDQIMTYESTKNKSLKGILKEGITSNRKTVKEIKLKNGDIIPANSSVSVEFFGDKEPNGNTRCRLKIDFIGESGRNYYEEPLNIKIETLSAYVSGFKQPSIKTMEKWGFDGIALTPTGKRVEPDGYGPDDSPSWLLVLGLM